MASLLQEACLSSVFCVLCSLSMPKLTDYRDKTAVITGASSGIGRLLALRLAQAGARVGLVARRQAELEKVASEIRTSGGTASIFPCDIACRDCVLTTAERVRKELGEIDLLVNNAGYGHHRSFLEWDLADI